MTIPSSGPDPARDHVETVGPGARPSALGRPPRRFWLVLSAVVVATVIAVAAVAILLTAGSVTVTNVNWFGMNKCGGLSGSTTPGFRGTEGGSVRYSVPQVVNSNATSSCTINSIESLDPGFGVTTEGFPLFIPAGGSTSLNITISLIDGDFDANLSLIVL